MHTVAMMEKDIEDLTSVAKSQNSYFEPRQRLWIARLLNTWIAHECGRPPIKTPFDASLVPPTPCNPVPEDQSRLEEIEGSIMKLAALDAQQCHDGVLLSHTIMALCFHRLLRSKTVDLDRQTFGSLVEIGLDGLQAAKRLAQRQKPWWHLANVPFQFLCAMLVIDTPSSFAQIAPALRAFEDVARAMPSSAITEALEFATRLIGLSKMHKVEQLQYLDECSETSQEHRFPFRCESTYDQEGEMQPSAEGGSVPWQIFDSDELGDISSFDWSFLPSMDIPIFEHSFQQY